MRREGRKVLDVDARSYDDVSRLGRILGSYVDQQAGHRRDASDERLRATVDALGAVRPFGGTGLRARGPAAEAEELDAVARLAFPEAWVLHSNEHSDLEVGKGRFPTGGVGESCLYMLALLWVAFHLVRLALVPDAMGPAIAVTVSRIGGPPGGLAVAVLLLVLALLCARRGSRIARIARSGVYGSYRRTNKLVSDPPRITLGDLRNRRRGHLARHIQSERRRRWRSVAVHELCHRFEEVVPGISDLEREFLERRLGTRRKRLLIAGERWRDRLDRNRSLRAISGRLMGPPRFFAWYSAVSYRGGPAHLGPSAHYEVFSTAYQAMTFGYINEDDLTLAPEHQPDEEHRNFVLGILALL